MTYVIGETCVDGEDDSRVEVCSVDCTLGTDEDRMLYIRPVECIDCGACVDPVRPPRNEIPTVSEGRRWLVAKHAFEQAYVWHARHGRRMRTALGW